MSCRGAPRSGSPRVRAVAVGCGALRRLPSARSPHPPPAPAATRAAAVDAVTAAASTSRSRPAPRRPPSIPPDTPPSLSPETRTHGYVATTYLTPASQCTARVVCLRHSAAVAARDACRVCRDDLRLAAARQRSAVAMPHLARCPRSLRLTVAVLSFPQVEGETGTVQAGRSATSLTGNWQPPHRCQTPLQGQVQRYRSCSAQPAPASLPSAPGCGQHTATRAASPLRAPPPRFAPPSYAQHHGTGGGWQRRRRRQGGTAARRGMPASAIDAPA